MRRVESGDIVCGCYNGTAQLIVDLGIGGGELGIGDEEGIEIGVVELGLIFADSDIAACADIVGFAPIALYRGTGLFP